MNDILVKVYKECECKNNPEIAYGPEEVIKGPGGKDIKSRRETLIVCQKCENKKYIPEYIHLTKLIQILK